MPQPFANLMSTAQARRWAVHAAGAAALLAASLGYYYWLYAPLQQEAADRLRRIDQLECLVDDAEQIARGHRELELGVERLRTAAAQTRQRMPALEPGIDLIHQASQIAKNAGLQVVHCTAGVPQTKKTHATVEIICRMTGSYLSICRYLAALDQLPQVATVSRLDVQSGGDSWQYPVEVTFRLYYRGETHDTEQGEQR
jgi:Tfp pilus assembly protein PilO